MGIIKINWNRKVTVFGRTNRDQSISSSIFHPDFPKKIDYSNPIATFFPAEFPIEEWKSIPEFETWCENNLPDLSGVFYFCMRAILHQPKYHSKKKKAGRPKYTRVKLLRRGFWKRPRQSSQAIRTVVAKIEMEQGQVVKVFEKQRPRKYAPYGCPTYELIKQIQRNAG